MLLLSLAAWRQVWGPFFWPPPEQRVSVWCQPNAEVLIHQPLGGTSGQATDICIHAEHILKTRAKLNKIFSDCTGQSSEKIEADTERDNIMSAEEALKYGLVDKVGDPISEW